MATRPSTVPPHAMPLPLAPPPIKHPSRRATDKTVKSPLRKLTVRKTYYFCRHFSTSANISLIISEPSIVEFPSDTHVTEGEEVYLRVKVGGHPPPSLTWYHDGREVTADYATELDQDGGLSFPSVETKHGGEYRL